MITCTLNGRMGNQLFQIAATIATALKYKVPYSISRKTINDLFPVYFDYLPCENHSGRMHSHTEMKNEYEEIKYFGRTLKLNGYFQSYKYFQDYRKEILSALGFNYILLKDFVSIHVRRGDYLTNPDFTVLGIYYYHQAIEFFKEKGYKNFWVFSDDMDWCKKNIHKGIFQDCNFLYAEGEPERNDMCLMSCCEHNIIANSSFSWWGAWLNRNPDKIVVVPDTWFKNVNKDLLPPEWLKFKNE